MLAAILAKPGESFPHDPMARGWHVVYRRDELNHCPGCGRSHWYVGRLSAECGFCGTALPLAETFNLGSGTHRRGRTPAFDDYADAA